MGNTLSGLTPSQTFQGLIKVGNNTNVDGTAKVLSDGAGTDLPMEVSTAGVNLTGSPTVNSVAIANTNEVAAKQDTLVSGTNIKTINSNSLLGSGDVAVQETLVSGTNIKTINSTSLLGSGDITISANPSGVSGAIQFTDGSAFASDAANLFWDDANNRLGVGTNAPSAKIGILQPFGASSLNQLDRMGFFVSYSGGAFGLALGGSSSTAAGCVQGTNIAGDAVNKLSLNPFGGNVAVGQVSSGPGLAMLEIKGSGTTSATTSLLVQNSAGTQAFKVEDGGAVKIGLTSSINWTFSSNTLSSSQFAVISGALGSILSTGGVSGGVHGNNNGGKVADSGISTAQVASAVLEVSSTTRGFLPPRMTTTQKNAIASPAAGLVVYDTTLNKLCVYTTAWETITSL